jgi:hypothetical protein
MTRVLTVGLSAAEGTACKSMDRRRQKRYELKAKVTFSWKDAGGNRCSGQSFLRDISESGIFVLTQDSLYVGAKVRLEIFFDFGSGFSMHAGGQVVRVEPSEQVERLGGFAAALKTVTLSNETSEEKIVRDLGIAGEPEEE